MILIPKYTDLYNKEPMLVSGGGFKGFIKMVAVNKFSGKERLLADWFPNLVLDSGLNAAGTTSWMGYCQVGSGSTPPVVGDTALEVWVAGTSSTQSTSEAAQGSEPWYGSSIRTKRFAEGAAAGNLSEVGFGWGLSGSTLFSRALILDGALQPTTITVLSDEFLDVSYEMRLYPPLVDDLGTITLDSVVYDVINRTQDVTNSFWATGIGDTQGLWKGTNGFYYYARNGNIGPIDGEPSGSGDGAGAKGNVGAYGNNDLYRDLYATWGLNDYTIGGLRSVALSTTSGKFQSQFDAQSGGAAIPKDNTKTLTLNWRISWDRH